MTVSTTDKPSPSLDSVGADPVASAGKKAPESMHEPLQSFEVAQMPSERNFGFVFTAVFLLAGLLPLLSGHAIRPIPLYVAGGLLLITLIAPMVLRPLNLLWYKFGLLLHKVVSPLVLAVLFYGVMTPLAFASRAMGKDFLLLKLDRRTSSYWIPKTPVGPKPEAMKRQY